MKIETEISTIRVLPINCGFADFKDANHISNFLNYLLSQSKNHSTNELTDLNVISIPNSENFCSSSNVEKEYLKEIRDAISNKFSRKLYDYESLTNTIDYIGFYYKKGDMIYTNVIEQSEDGEYNSFLLQENFPERFYQTWDFESPEELISWINSLVDLKERKKILLYDEIIKDKEFWTDIQLSIISEIILSRDNYVKENHGLEGMLYVTHNDQKNHFFHMHTIFYQNN